MAANTYTVRERSARRSPQHDGLEQEHDYRDHSGDLLVRNVHLESEPLNDLRLLYDVIQG